MSFGISEAIWLVVKEPTVCSANSRRRKAVGHPKPPIRETGMLYPRPFAKQRERMGHPQHVRIEKGRGYPSKAGRPVVLNLRRES
jgi:hypothetical protein